MGKILLEDTHGEFVPQRDKITVQESVIKESAPGASAMLIKVPGRFSVAGEINGNNRRYTRSVWEKNLQEGSHLRTLVEKSASFGLLEHPEDGHVDLRSPISHIVSNVYMEGDEVYGEITILSRVPEGQKLLALIEAGYNPLVSSRGYGSLAKAADGVDEVQDDYVCEGWDVVINPSFSAAQLKPNRESIFPNQKPQAPIKEGQTPKQTPKQTPLSPAPANESAPKQQKPKAMELGQIRESISSLKSVNPVNLKPQDISEGFNRMSELHREVARYAAEDQSRSWDANVLHRDIQAIEEAWHKTAEAPKIRNTALQEQNAKLAKVTQAISERAVLLKNKLEESNKEVARLKGLVNEVASRGRKWKQRAESIERKSRLTESRYDVACEALDIMADRYKGNAKRYNVACESLDVLAEKYNKDVVTLGRRVLTLEFAPTDKDIVKRLAEAKHPAEVVRIRESIEKALGKKPGAKKPVTESTPKAPVTPGAPAAPVITEAQIVRQGRGSPDSLNESIGIARRLSAANAS